MAEKKIGISPDLIIPPGETIAELLEDRNLTQAELAAIVGKTPSFLSQVINGSKRISPTFAKKLEYAFGVPASFWNTLQANYDAELYSYEEANSITKEEKAIASKDLKEFASYLFQKSGMKTCRKADEAVLSLRRMLRVSSLCNLSNVALQGAYRISDEKTMNQYVMGAWVRMCQLIGEKSTVKNIFDKSSIGLLIDSLKKIMCNNRQDLQRSLIELFSQFGIQLSLVRHFKGAPVQGYICKRNDGSYQMVLTLRKAWADIFWFSLFHELGHIYNGDVTQKRKFVDYERGSVEEAAADQFACDHLLSPDAYMDFCKVANFQRSSIVDFAKSQGVKPYIVIGRLQRERRLPYGAFNDLKLRYKWKETA